MNRLRNPIRPLRPEVLPVRRRSSRLLVLTTLASLVATAVVGSALPAAADTAPKPGLGLPATVSTDSLPAPQINGVVWDQVVVGNTVYVAGRFSQARPSGVGKGATGTAGRVARSNVLAYDITTGALLPGFAPRFNSEVRAIAASADGSKLFAVGNFTAVNGVTHTRIAAVDARTGANEHFSGSLNSNAYALATKGNAVYVGGQFTKASGKKRTRLAAFDADDGSLRAWAPTADRAVQGLAVAPNGGSVVIGGHFGKLNGKTSLGSGRVPSTGSAKKNVLWNANKVANNNGANAAIYSVSGDRDYVYLTGYSYHQKGVKKRLEGTLAASWSTGNVHWVEDCHGDTYDAVGIGSVVYTASHAHSCATLGSFTESKDPVRYNHAMAFTKAARLKLKKPVGNYTSFAGEPGPAVLNWWPAFTNGTYTGLKQATWTVTGDSRYVVYGGEFPTVNGTAQQGLARFAVSSIAPNRDGPRVSGDGLKPALKASGGGAVTITFTSDFDRDNEYLTYTITRTTGSEVVSQAFTSGSRYYFSRPVKTVTQTGLVPGTTYAYRITATDPFGNTASGTTAYVAAK
jgi:hypothetical protein